MKRRQVVAVLAVAPLLAAAACGGSGGSSGSPSSGATFNAKPKGTLNAWAFDSADDVGKARMKYADEQLKKQNVTVKYDQTAFNAQKFTTRLASGNVPDIVQMDRQYVATYAAQNLIMPLDQCFSAHKVDPKTVWYPSVLGDVTYKGKIWAVPQFYQPTAIILNKKVMDAAGVTSDQIDTSKPDVLLAAIKKMYKQKGNVPSTLGFDPQPTGQWQMWMLGLGGQIVDKNGKPTLDNPNNVYPLEMLKKITDAQGGYAKLKSFTDSFDFFGDNNQYVKNQVGAEVDAQWYPNVLSPFKNKISIETVPFKDKNGKPVTYAGGTSFAIPTKAKNKSAACAWAITVTSQADWMAAGKARADTIAKNGGVNTGLFTGSPGPDKEIKSKYVKSSGNPGFDQTINAYYDIVGDGITMGASPAGQQIQTEMNNAIASALLGKKSPKQALADAQRGALRAYNNVVH
ncbi:MAG TPA: hypothetical protein VF053_00865 [Streptosporangiales bacterium]